MSQVEGSTSRNSKTMRPYLLVFAAGLVPVALSYGIDPGTILPSS
jgi:hypothetical protein